MRLERLEHGPEDGRAPPLLIAHGLYGSARNWGVLARRLAEGRRVVAVDMRNHGGSPWSDDHSYAALAGDLAEMIEEIGAPADVLGHSMGGKAAMVLALGRPGLVRRLVVADIAPVAYGHGAEQVALAEAMLGLDPAALPTRAEADSALAATVPDAAVRAFLLQSLDPRAGRWHLNLAALAAGMEGITGWPSPPGRFEGPALFLRGERSDYVRPEHEPAIRAQFPAARIETVPGAGHWVHAEAPRETEAIVRAFLDAPVDEARASGAEIP